jgi:membrane protease YdiL (CAAX protease family)
MLHVSLNKRRFAYAPVPQSSLISTLPQAALSWILVAAAIWLMLAILNNIMWEISYSHALAEMRGEPVNNDPYFWSLKNYHAANWFALAVILGARWWVQTIETRSLASAGFIRSDAMPLARIAFAGIVVILCEQLFSYLAIANGAPPPVTGVNAAMPPVLTADAWPAAVNLFAFLVMILAIASGSVAEEVFYRGWMLSALTPAMGLPMAIALSGVIFAWTHIGPSEMTNWAMILSFADYMLISAMFSIVALRQGVWAAAAFHVAQNLAIMALDAAEGLGDVRAVIAAWDTPRGTQILAEAVAHLALSCLILAALWTRLPQRQELADAPPTQPAP